METNNDKNNSIKKFLNKLLEKSVTSSLLRLIGIFTTTITILKGLEYLGVNIQELASSKNSTLVLFILLITVSIELLLTKQNLYSQDKNSKSFMDSFEQELLNLFKSKQFRKILRLRDAMSRYLWVEGSLKARIVLGEYSEESALQLGDIRSQVAALIDDMGWTLVAMKEYTRAAESIKHGGELARKEGLVYWEAKAKRHIAGIYTIKNEFQKAYDALEEARPLAELVADPIKKLEIVAGIEYAIAMTALREKDLEKAEIHVEKSDELRRKAGDDSRTIRCASLRGKIELEKGNLGAAKDHFRVGLEESTSIGRRDEMIRNHLGLAFLFKNENNIEKYNYHKSISNELKKDTPVPYEIDDTDKELHAI